MAKRAYQMTPARRAALKRAQAASARKRRGTGKGKLAAANRQLDLRKRKGPSRLRRIGGAVGRGAKRTGRVAGRWAVPVAVGAAYFHAQGGTADVKYVINQHRTNRRKAKRSKDWAAHDAHLRKMRYGSSSVSNFVKSSRKPQLALTSRRR